VESRGGLKLFALLCIYSNKGCEGVSYDDFHNYLNDCNCTSINQLNHGKQLCCSLKVSFSNQFYITSLVFYMDIYIKDTAISAFVRCKLQIKCKCSLHGCMVEGAWWWWECGSVLVCN